MLYPVVDVELNTPTHQIGLGMDVGLFPSRKAAFEQARDEQRVIATAPADFSRPLTRQVMSSSGEAVGQVKEQGARPLVKRACSAKYRSRSF